MWNYAKPIYPAFNCPGLYEHKYNIYFKFEWVDVHTSELMYKSRERKEEEEKGNKEGSWKNRKHIDQKMFLKFRV